MSFSAARPRLADLIGLALSSTCLIHCLALPMLLLLAPALGHWIALPEWTHAAILTLALPAAFAAMRAGGRRHPPATGRGGGARPPRAGAGGARRLDGLRRSRRHRPAAHLDRCARTGRGAPRQLAVEPSHLNRAGTVRP